MDQPSGDTREHRGLKRIRVQLPVGVVGDLLDATAEVLNLSTGGCRLRGDRSLKDSPYLRLLLYSPEDNVPIKVELAIIRWVSDDEFGIEFIRMHAEQQQRLRQLLRLVELTPGSDYTAAARRPISQRL